MNKKCLICGKKVKKKFCCLKHKDRWHNIHNPRGIFAHLNTKDMCDSIEDSMHPSDPYALGQE